MASKDQVIMRASRSILVVPLLLVATMNLPAVNNSAAPMPRIDTVLKRVAAQAEKENENTQEFRKRYAYTRTRVTEYRNSKGEVKKREEKKGENDPLRNALAVAAQPVVAKPRRTDDAKSDQPVSDSHSKVRGKAFKKSEFILDEDLIGRFDFTVVGREVLNGRSALIVDFQPAKKKLPVRNLKDKFINRAAGRVWVDEADYAVAKVDLHLTEKVNVVGGLVGAVWKFTYDFLRERTPEGYWFTRNSKWHLEGREVFIRRTVDYHEQRTGVRRVTDTLGIDGGDTDD